MKLTFVLLVAIVNFSLALTNGEHISDFCGLYFCFFRFLRYPVI